MKKTAILLAAIALAALLLSGCCALMHHRDGHGHGCGCEKKYDCRKDGKPCKECPEGVKKQEAKPCCPDNAPAPAAPAAPQN